MTLVNFERLLGQQKAKDILLNSYKNGKMSHAYLFRGPAGVGKKTVALSLAAFLNCRDNANNDFCGKCSSCLKFASRNHADYHLIEPDGNAIKIGQIRALKKVLSFPPLEARYRVVVLPDIDKNMRKKEVANSLLKTLEEPPNGTIIILTAGETGHILPTILSRSHTVPFYPLKYELVANKLIEAQKLSREEAETLAAITNGSLGESLNLFEQDLLAFRRGLIEKIVGWRKDSGLTVEEIILWAEKSAALKGNIFCLLDLLKLWFRDIVLYHCSAGKFEIINEDLRQTLKAASEKWQHDDLFGHLERIDRAAKQLNHNCNHVSVCEVLFWELI